MKNYKEWLEKQIEICLEDPDLQREHWAFCKAYEKLVAEEEAAFQEAAEMAQNMKLFDLTGSYPV